MNRAAVLPYLQSTNAKRPGAESVLMLLGSAVRQADVFDSAWMPGIAVGQGGSGTLGLGCRRCAMPYYSYVRLSW